MRIFVGKNAGPHGVKFIFRVIFYNMSNTKLGFVSFHINIFYSLQILLFTFLALDFSAEIL